MKNIIKISLLCIGFLLVSCFNKEKPNYQFMASTDMYEPVGYETYYEVPQTAFSNGMEAQLPAENTIKRGWMPYMFDNTNQGYEQAKALLQNPLKNNTPDDLKKHIQKGAELFNIYCMVCHGSEGDGQGILAKREKIMGIPSFDSRDITQGSIYHVIYYGRNAMGSYASQITENERWQVALYVEQLREKLINKSK